MSRLFGGRVARRLEALVALLVPALLVIPSPLSAQALTVAPGAQADQQCFPQTGQCISGRIRQYWQENGGLEVFGYPTTDQHQEVIESRPFQVQWFERNRLELHP